MVTRTPAYRSVEWAIRLSWVCLAVVVIGCMTCMMAAIPISSGAAVQITRSSPPATDCTDGERDEWAKRTAPIHSAAYHATGRLAELVAVCVGLPVALLLIANIIILSRARWQMIRGR